MRKGGNVNYKSEHMKQMTFNQLKNELANCDDPIKEVLIRKLIKKRYLQLMHYKQINSQNRNDRINGSEYTNHSVNNINNINQANSGNSGNNSKNYIDDIGDIDDHDIDPLTFLSEETWNEEAEFGERYPNNNNPNQSYPNYPNYSDNSNYPSYPNNPNFSSNPNYPSDPNDQNSNYGKLMGDNLYRELGPLNDLDSKAKLYDNKFKKEIRKDFVNNNLTERMNSDIAIKNFRIRNKTKDFIPPFTNTNSSAFAPFHGKTLRSDDFSNRRLME